ncbi:MAG: hypothetical protein QXO71_06165, partial [Candidatus Jordarchaeaceae archaeon]
PVYRLAFTQPYEALLHKRGNRYRRGRKISFTPLWRGQMGEVPLIVQRSRFRKRNKNLLKTANKQALETTLRYP